MNLVGRFGLEYIVFFDIDIECMPLTYEFGLSPISSAGLGKGLGGNSQNWTSNRRSRFEACAYCDLHPSLCCHPQTHVMRKPLASTGYGSRLWPANEELVQQTTGSPKTPYYQTKCVPLLEDIAGIEGTGFQSQRNLKAGLLHLLGKP